LTNLIGNSIRYSPKGGSVEIAANLEDGLVHLSVSDHGLGIPPELHPKIWFESTGVAGEGSTFHVQLPLAPVAPANV
jgi:signal transduction histidine kinase